MHRISKASILNYRSCRSLVDIEFSDFTPIVGYNNAGKSNVLSALNWALRPSVLDQADFFAPTMRISVEARIDGITKAVLDQLGETHRPRIEPFVKDGALRIARGQEAPGGSKSNIKLRVRDPAKAESDRDAWRENPTGIDAAIQVLFPEPIVIAAMEDAGRDVARFDAGSTIGKLIAKLLVSVKAAKGEIIAQRLEDLRKLLSVDGEERAPELAEFDSAANAIVADFFPGIEVKVHVPPPAIDAVFKAGTIRVFEAHGGVAGDKAGRDVASLGHGSQRAIQMALIRQLAETAAGPRSGRTLLLIDEPELYLHPQAVAKVRSALHRLSEGAYQVVFTTHSPLMIGRGDLSSVLVLSKSTTGETTKRRRLGQALATLEKEAAAQLDELFDVEGANQVLFSDRVILAEGRTERELLPDLFAARHGAAPADRRIGVVPVDGSLNIPKCLRVLDRMEIPARAVVDLDFALRAAGAAGLLAVDDPDVATCRERCPDIAQAAGGNLAPDGFFQKERRTECLEALARDEAAQSAIGRLHEKLRAKNIWVWWKGAIEPHLGLKEKNRGAWRELRTALGAKGLSAVADSDGVGRCMAWLAGGSD